MTVQPTNRTEVLDLLEGTWKGNGRGQFPGVTSFDYRETLTFTRRDEKTLAYEQRTQKLYDGQIDWLPSHWESGFIRVDADETAFPMGWKPVDLPIVQLLSSLFIRECFLIPAGERE